MIYFFNQNVFYIIKMNYSESESNIMNMTTSQLRDYISKNNIDKNKAKKKSDLQRIAVLSSLEGEQKRCIEKMRSIINNI